MDPAPNAPLSEEETSDEPPTSALRFSYRDEGATITIIRLLSTNVESVVIPETIDGKPVTKIASGDSINFAFRNAVETLKDVSAPSIIDIGSYAFYGCTNLTNAQFPSAETVRFMAFYFCTNLITANVPEANSIGDRAFQYCSLLTDATVSKATNIGECAFSSCFLLTNVDCSAATRFKYFSFTHCSNLLTVTICAPEPPNMYAGFQNTPTNKTLFVPLGFEAEYASWKTEHGFATITGI